MNLAKKIKPKSLESTKKYFSFFKYLAKFEKTSPFFMSKINGYHEEMESIAPDEPTYWRYHVFKMVASMQFDILQKCQRKTFNKIRRTKINHVEVLVVLLNYHYRAEAGKLSIRNIRRYLPHRSVASVARSIVALERLGFIKRTTKYWWSAKRYRCSRYEFVGFKSFFSRLSSNFQRLQRGRYAPKKPKKEQKKKPEYINLIFTKYTFNVDASYRQYRVASNE